MKKNEINITRHKRIQIRIDIDEKFNQNQQRGL